MDKDQLEQLLGLWKFMAWCDQMRWKSESGDWGSLRWDREEMETTAKALNLAETPTYSEIVLAHWLTSIFDFQVRADHVWSECLPIMIKIAHDFSEGVSVDKIRRDIVKTDVRGDKKIETLEFSSFSFGHRFQERYRLHERVWRTLHLLERLPVERNFVQFLLSQTVGEDWVRRVAWALNTLTYSEETEEKALELLQNGRIPNRLKEDVLDYPKRLWMALRDYIKPWRWRDRVVMKAIGEHRSKYRKAVGIWEKSEDYLDQLELPSDQWNKRFFDRIKLLQELAKQERCEGSPRKLLRRLYNEYREELRGCYPEQFDVTFNFRCNLWACLACPLLKNGTWEKYCSKEEGEPCEVLKLLLGYNVKCEPETCYLLHSGPLSICDGVWH